MTDDERTAIEDAVVAYAHAKVLRAKADTVSKAGMAQRAVVSTWDAFQNLLNEVGDANQDS